MLRKVIITVIILATAAPAQVQAASYIPDMQWCSAAGHTLTTPWFWFLRPCQSITGHGNS